MRMGQCSVACVAKQGAKIRVHKKAAEILKPLPLLNMWQDKIIENPFVFLHSKKMQKKKKNGRKADDCKRKRCHQETAGSKMDRK